MIRGNLKAVGLSTLPGTVLDKRLVSLRSLFDLGLLLVSQLVLKDFLTPNHFLSQVADGFKTRNILKSRSPRSRGPLQSIVQSFFEEARAKASRRNLSRLRILIAVFVFLLENH